MRRIISILGLTITTLMMLGSPPLAKETTTDLPEWLSRVYYGLEIKSDRKPRFFFQSVQPLWRSPEKERVFFIQPHISIRGDIQNYSIGLGYRQLLKDRKYLIGTNTFYDYQDDYDHRQVGVGLEALGETLEARLNAYFGLSDAKLVDETSTYREYEKVVDGFDAELGSKIPQLPWAKIFAGGFWYNAKYADNLEGWKTRLELKPLEWLTIDLGVQDDNQSKTKWLLGLEFHIPLGGGMSLPKESASHTEGSFDLTSRLLDPVERNFIPTLEVWQSDKTGTVTGRILDQNDDPVINAKVEIHSAVVTVYTNIEGYFSANVVPGPHMLYAWNSNGEPIIDYGLEITVTETGTKDIGTLDVNDPYHAPKFISLSTADPTPIPPKGQSTIRFEVSDVDGDTIYWRAKITSTPPWGRIHGRKDGKIPGGWGDAEVTYVAPEEGPYLATITITLDDKTSEIVSDSIQVVVKEEEE